MSTTLTTTTARPAKWERVGAARVLGSGLWIAAAGRQYAISGEDLAAFLFEGEPATVYEIDPAGAVEPREAGRMDLSGSGRMVLVQIYGESYLDHQLPAADLAAHVERHDRATIPVMAPPSPSSPGSVAA